MWKIHIADFEEEIPELTTNILLSMFSFLMTVVCFYSHSPLDLFWDDLCQMANLPEGVEIDLYGDPRNSINNSAVWPLLDRSQSPHKVSCTVRIVQK